MRDESSLNEGDKPDEIDRLIEEIFKICETYGGDYQAKALRELLVKREIPNKNEGSPRAGDKV